LINPLRNSLARPIIVRHKPSRVFGYISVVDHYGEETSHLDSELDGMEAIRQSIFHIVNTERFMYPIYDDSWGIELEQFVGNTYNFFRVKIEQVFQDAIYQDDRIRNVKLIRTENPQPNVAFAEFEIETIYGRMREGFETIL